MGGIMKRTKHSFLFSIIVTMFVFFCIMSIVKLQIEVNSQTAENQSLKEENEHIKYEIDQYNNDLETPKDKEYYEEKAREKLNLRLPEEIIFYNDLIN